MPAIHTFFFKNPNAFGNYLVILATFLICLFFYGDLGGGVRKLLAAVLLLMGAAVVFTFSRSSWLGLLTGLMGINLVRPNPKAITIVICNQIETYDLVRFHQNGFSAGHR